MRRLRRVALVAVLLVALAGTASALAPRPLPDLAGTAAVEFDRSEPPPARVSAATWGLTPRRTRWAAGAVLHPPYRTLWTLHARAMIELPPALANGRLYFGTHAGTFIAASTTSGDVVWRRRLRHCIASTPTIADGVVYVALMGPAPCTPHQEGARGGVIALSARTGRSLWMFHTGVVESSPLLVGGLLYFATYTARDESAVIALDARTHRPRWSYAVASKIAASPSAFGGAIYIGVDGGRVLALDAADGRPRWVARLSTAGGVYATAALAYGRVFVGGLDGEMYALGARSGSLLWRTRVGARVYSSAAVYGRTVFVASYENGRLWALDAATGSVRWSYGGSGRILGSPTVVDGLVYISTTSRTTLALGAETGEPAWSYPDGQYTAVVNDRDRLYLIGLGRIYGLAMRDGTGRARPS